VSSKSGAIQGLSVSSVAGTIWVIGVYMFIFLYPLPKYGKFIKGQELLKERPARTRAEVELIKGRGTHSAIPRNTLKWFIAFFCISGGVTLVGIITST